VIAWDGNLGKMKNGPSTASISAASGFAAAASASAIASAGSAALAQNYAAAAQAAVDQAVGVPGNSLVRPSGAILFRSLSDHLSQGAKVFHSKDFSGIDHTGVTDSLSGMQKFFNKAGDLNSHTILIIDSGKIKLGNDVAAMSAILGNLTINAIKYLSTNVVKVNMSLGSALTSSTVINAIATGSSFLTIEGAANDDNNGRFTITDMKNASASSTANGSTDTFSFPSYLENAGELTVTVAKSYTGDGSTVTYAFPPQISAAGELAVTVAGVLKTNGVHYNIDTGGVGNPAGGTITFTGGNTPANLAAIVLTATKVNGVHYNINTGGLQNLTGGMITFTSGNVPANATTVALQGQKYVLISTTRSDASLDETSLNLTSNTNRIRIAGMESLYYRDNCTIICHAELIDYINTGKNFCISSYNPDNDAGILTVQVFWDFQGGFLRFPDVRNFTQSQKGLGMTNVEYFGVKGYRTVGYMENSFTGQGRNSRYGVITGAGIFSGDTVGEDGWHHTRNCWDIIIADMIIFGGDDCISLTQENDAAAYLMERIQISNCILRTKNNSSFKCLLDSVSVNAGARIRDITVNGCHFGVQNNTGAGSLVRLTTITGFEESLCDVILSDCTMDNQAGGVGFLASTSIRFDYTARCQLSDSSITGCVRNAIIMNGGYDNVIKDNLIGMPATQASVTDVTGTITDIASVSGTTMKATFSGSPDFSTVGATFTTITITGAALPSNNGTFIVTTSDNTLKTVSYTKHAKVAGASFNETGLTATGTVRKQAGELISLAGGDCHKISGNDFIGSYTDAGGKLVTAINAIVLKTNSATSQEPVNIRINDNHFEKFVTSGIVFLQNGQYIMVDGNKACKNTATVWLLEGSGATGNNVFLDNEEYGNQRTVASFQMAKATSRHQRNMGSNADVVTGTATLLAAATTIVINIPDSTTGPSGTNAASDDATLGWTQGFNQGDPKPLNFSFVFTSSPGNATAWWVGYNSGTRNLTITFNNAPGADATIAWRLFL